MKIETLRKSNVKLWVSKPAGKEKYYKTGRELVIDLLCGMAKLAIKCYENGIVDFPYRYGERQLTSLILPALSKISNGAVLSEYPIKRNRHLKNCEYDNASGRLDYWCMYKDFSFAIEVKQSRDAFKTSTTCQEDITKWKSMLTEQIPSLKDEIKQKWDDPSKGIIPIGLQFVTSCSYSETPLEDDKRRKLIDQYRKNIPNILSRLYHDVCRYKPKQTTPDIIACWMPSDEMILQTNEYWTYPGLIVMGKLFQPIDK